VDVGPCAGRQREAPTSMTARSSTRLWSRLGQVLRRVPRQERGRALVEAIIEAAEVELATTEVGPLHEIFERAGVAAGSFYDYFASREALLTAVVEHVTDRNFQLFLAGVDARIAMEDDFEQLVRWTAALIARSYWERPKELRRLVRVADHLDLASYISHERDRFAELLAGRIERYTPQMRSEARLAMMRAAADAVTGVVVLAVYRDPIPSLPAIEEAATDAAWGVISLHLARSRA
jgi:AcrR family transcriptional regulator